MRRITIALPVAGCSYAPTLDLLGSYFPARMLCAAIGIVAAIIIRQILAVTSINDCVIAGRQFIPILAIVDSHKNLAGHRGKTQFVRITKRMVPARCVVDAPRRGSGRGGRRPTGTAGPTRTG